MLGLIATADFVGQCSAAGDEDVARLGLIR
jgi:hypothetical protein